MNIPYSFKNILVTYGSHKHHNIYIYQVVIKKKKLQESFYKK